MPLVEAVTIEVGASIAKSILKVWLKDTVIGEDVSSNIIDLIKGKTSNVLAQRRGNRQFEEIGEKVGASLLPLFQAEGARLDEGSRIAVACEVAATFNKARISAEVLARNNLQPTELEKYVLVTEPEEVRRFSSSEQEFYRHIIKEACSYIVDIASQLPAFTEHTFAEVLKREGQILSRVDQVLQELSQIRRQLDPMVEAERFEIEYRDAVARNLDVLQMIGADVSQPNRRHRLSIAYITLSVEQIALPGSINEYTMRIENHETNEDAQEEPTRGIVPVDSALAQSRRLLIRGEAGSGKTTLLQWIAVRAATKSFEGSLAGWNDKLPFYVRLRRFAQESLPGPEDFPGLVALAIADTMPDGWAHDALKSGCALILVDGIDEVTATRREEVHNWLKDLMGSYPDAHYIVTSRPYAIEEGWMDHESFGDAELQPMEPGDIASFIEHWHNAVRGELLNEEEKKGLEPLAEHLKEQIRLNRPIRNLATNPLLCTMLCALNRDRRQQLPINRIELYKACCTMLLERRDKESRVDLSDYPALGLTQKQRLLEDLAYQMIKEGLTEIAATAADGSFENKLANMPNIPLNITGERVRKLFVERSGIIREPVAEQIGFSHRTFQEFFAARAARDADDVGMLIENAHNDQWREVIVLAVGLAPQAMSERIIEGLIERGDREEKQRYQLHLLAVACLETAVVLGTEVKAEVDKRLGQIVPPKNMKEAKEIAAAGDLAVKYLIRKEKYTNQEASACMRALALIGGDTAFDVIKEYINDKRQAVVNEFLKDIVYFDHNIYIRDILSKVIEDSNSLHLRGLIALDGVQHLKNLGHITIDNCIQVRNLSPLANLINITHLELSGCRQINDISSLANLTNLTLLYLTGCGQVRDLSPLSHLLRLTSLHLYGCKQVRDFSPLSCLTNLTYLGLSGCEQMREISSLAHLLRLTTLQLSGCKQLHDLSPLMSLTNLEVLFLSGSQISDSDLSPLVGLTNLVTLHLSWCDQIRDLGILTELPNLKALVLRGIRDKVIIPQSIEGRVRVVF